MNSCTPIKHYLLLLCVLPRKFMTPSSLEYSSKISRVCTSLRVNLQLGMSASGYTNKRFAGIKAANLDQINKKFICAYCEHILQSPWQLLCSGVLLCEYCLRKGLSSRKPFLCPYCHEEHETKEASPDRGIARELNMVIIVCYLCSWNGSYNDYLNHLKDMHANLECADCHEHFSTINLFEEHRQELCIHRSMPCGLPNCANSIKWYDMQAHYVTDQHQYSLIMIILQYISSNHDKSVITNRSNIIIRELMDIQENVNLVFSIYEILLKDSDRLKTELSQIEILLNQNSSETKKLEECNHENEKAKKELCDCKNCLEELLETTKRDIEEIPSLILDSDATVTLRFNYPNSSLFSLDSSKFRTSEYGYIFTISVRSTNEAEKWYLSIFLTLYNGEYSNLLSYPFSFPIHFVLWDQSNKQQHITYILKPDPNASAFMRPSNEKNEEFCIKNLCSLDAITDSKSAYVKDGVFFIRLFIDFFNVGENPFQSENYLNHNEFISSKSMLTE
ncbi:unnamed protein product [Rotaria magnacalcarata]|uniref:TRAF1-6 MATH domain-containing protein n=2 Tax=Rotaria magnacalcarata TaxID=392030 RepID=A0A816L8C7_9BILA|nr:unnamed protein product [Rotaria magnacalcarata]CAF1933059.1 unnamed protein product [Rotaria magnacalcarata]